MYPRHHFLLSLAVALLLYPTYGLSVWLVLAGGVLLDVDHVIFYWWKTGKLQIRATRKQYAELCDASEVFLFLHFIEVLVLLLVASLFYETAFLLMVGVALHIFLDVIYERRVKKTGRVFSFFAWLGRKKKE